MTASKRSLRVLIIDDEADMCWALQRIVESEGHTCVIAHSAPEALQAVAAGAFQLAFVDVKLPGMDGLELLQHLRKWAPQLPCVVVSGYYYDDDEPVHAALESGAISSFISKPFLLTQVREALQVALAPSP